MDFQAYDASFHNRASDRKNAELTTFEAVKAQATALGEDAELLTCPPFFKALIRKHSDQEKLIAKKLLADKIRIGDLEDESGNQCPLWAYLADNTFADRLTELVYFSLDRSKNKMTIQAASNAHGGRLREEFMHCETPLALTATAKLYLFRKGINTSYPVEISKYLTIEMIRACKTFKDKSMQNLNEVIPDDHANEQDAMDMTEDGGDWVEQHREPGLSPQGPVKTQTFDTRASSAASNTYTAGFQYREYGLQYHANTTGFSSSLDAGRSTREPTRNTTTPHASSTPQAQDSSNTNDHHTYVGIDLVHKIQAEYKQEQEIATKVQDIQHQLIIAEQDIAGMRERYAELQDETARLGQAILAADTGRDNLKQREKDLHVAMVGCRDNQMRMMDSLDPNTRHIIEFGRQLERNAR